VQQVKKQAQVGAPIAISQRQAAVFRWLSLEDAEEDCSRRGFSHPET
jgi:hypothetical protein